MRSKYYLIYFKILPMGGFIGSADELRLFGIIAASTLGTFAIWVFIRVKVMGSDLLPQAGPPGEFAWTTLALSLWYFGGLVLDGWAHTHGVVEEAFFTPWHAIFYSGFTAFAGFIVWTLWRLADAPISFTPAGMKTFLSGMPKGYGPAVTGMVLFGIAGFGDMIWHALFGIEGGLDILLSTTHLMLAAGMAIAVMAPFWASWHHPHEDEDTFSGQLPAVISLGIMMSVMTFFTKYAHLQNLNLSEICQGKGSTVAAGAEKCSTILKGQGSSMTAVYDTGGLLLGVISMELQAVIMVGITLLFLRRWKPARGSLFTLFTINGIAVVFLSPGDLKDIPIKLLLPMMTGLMAEVLVVKVQPQESALRMRSFGFLLAFLAVFIWWLCMLWAYGFAIESSGLDIRFAPLGWTIHGTFGAFFLAGCAGAFISLLMHPPEVPLPSKGRA
jgi:hypothetical protein